MFSGYFKTLSPSRFFSLIRKRTSFLFIRKLLIVFLIWLIGGLPTIVFALPQDGQIVGGSGSITEPTATSMQIDQNTSKMVVNWQSFSIGGAESVNFSQPSSSSVALNRVIGSDPTLLLGKLTANGQVFITNGSGVFFGPGSQIDTYGLIATTMAISNQDFLNQNYNFFQQGSFSSVINEGNISATSYVGLLAPSVDNRGTIVTASLGSIDLAAGKAATLDFTGDGLIQFEVTQAVSGTVTDKDGNVLQDRVSNTGLLHADGGWIRMSAKDAGDVIRHVVNMEGMIQANSVAEEDGWVIFSGGDSGVVSVSGTIDASGDDAGEKGGMVQVTGEYVGLFDEAKIDVSGDAGGGTALIGGDYQGKNEEVQNAQRTYIGEDTVIDAGGGASGDGGKVIIWADETTRFYGSVSATGGLSGGDGGFIEISGKENLNFNGTVDASSIYGAAGTVLFDPRDITIANGGSDTVASNDAFAENSSTDVTFDADQITTITNAGTNVILQANQDIIINEAITTVNGGGAGGDITLQAGRSVLINANITTDDGNLTITANETTANGVQDADRGAGAAVITMAGSTTLAAGSGNISITMSDGTGKTNLTSDDITLDTVTTTGTLAIANNGATSGSDILQTNSFTVATGTVSFTVTGDGAITLTNASNNLGIVTLSSGTGTVQLAETGGNSFAASTLGGDLVVSTAGPIQQTGALVVAGTSSFTSTVGGGIINLVNAGNAFTGDVRLQTLGTGAASFTNTLATTFGVGTSNIGGALTVNSVNGISQNQAIVVTGTSSFTVTGANTLTLTNASNALTGAVTLVSGTGDVSLTDSTALSLGTTTLGGNLILSSGGALTQTGAWSVTGTSNFTVTGTDVMTLTQSNTFSGAVTLTSGTGTVQLTDSTDTILAASTLGGALTVISSGAITQTGALAVTGASAFTVSSTNTMTLTNASNDFTAGITLASGTGAIQLTDSTTSVITSATSSGANLSITSTDITITSINVGAGDLTIIASGGGSIGVGAGAGTMSITDAELNLITANNVNIGDSTSGNIIVDSVTAASTNLISGTITLDASGSTHTVTFSGAASVFENALTVTANSGINISVATLTTNQGDINLTGTLTLSNALSLTVDTGAGAGAITFNSLVQGDNSGGAEVLTITAGTGAVSVDALGTGLVNGIALVSITTTGAVALNGAINPGATSFGRLEVLSSASISLPGTITNQGNLILTTSGAISGTSTVFDINGTSSFTAAGANNITLDNASNDFTGAMTFSIGTGAITVVNGGAELVLAAGLTTTSALNITSTNGITLLGNITATGVGMNLSAATSGISLSNAVNAILSTGAGAGAITLTGGVQGNASGGAETLTLTAGTGAVTINGTVTGATNALVDLNITSGGAVTLDAINLALPTSSDLRIGNTTAVASVTFNSTVNATATLDITTTGSIIGTSGAFTIGTTTSLDTSGGTGVITLTDTGNAFTGGITLASGSGAVQLVDSTTSIITSATSSGGNLTITSTDLAITSINVGAGDVTLLRTGGTIGLGTTGSMSISDGELDAITAANVNIGDSTVGAITVDGITNTSVTGTLTLTSGSTITFSGSGSSVGGDISLTADKMAITVGIDATGDRVTLKSLTSGNSIDLGSGTDAASNTLELSDTELDFITANYLEIGSTTQGAINVSMDISPANIMVLHLISNSAITGADTTGGIVVANLAMEAKGTINFTDTTTDVDNLAISASGYDVTFYDTDDLDIDTVDTVVGVKAKTFTATGPGPLTTTSPIVLDPITSNPEQEAQVDQGTQSTFVDNFTAPANSGC